MDINSLLSPDSQESIPSRGISRSTSNYSPNTPSPAGVLRPNIHPHKSSALSYELQVDSRSGSHYSSPNPGPLHHHRQHQDHRPSLPSIGSYKSASNVLLTSSSSSSSSAAVAPASRHSSRNTAPSNHTHRENIQPSSSSPRHHHEARPQLQTHTASRTRGRAGSSNDVAAASRTPSSSTTAGTSGMDALAEVASRQRPQNLAASPTSNLRRHQLQQQHDRSSSSSSGSFAKSSTSRPSIHTPMTTSAVDAVMPDALPPPQHAHIASSLSATESRRLAELAAAITSNTFDFSAHLEYVSLLHAGFERHVEGGHSPTSGYELLDTLKQARNAMDQIFPVGETLWVDWLTDENLLAKTIDDRISLMELHHRSVLEEPCSAQLWLLYGDYMYYLWSSCIKDEPSSPSSNSEEPDGMGWTASDRLIGKEVFEWDSMIDVWEQGVQRTQWHLNDGNIVWDRYLEILQTDLARQESPEKIAKIRDRFVDRLTNRAHATWDQTLSAYSQFVSKYYPANYEEAMVTVTKRAARAKKVFELREPYEFRVQQAIENLDKQAEWTAYSEYLDWELRKKGVFSKDLINGLYERATTRFATDASLWNDYVEFLIESSSLTMQSPNGASVNANGNDEEALPALDGVLERATRHCPWSGELWSHRLLAMEVEGRSYPEVEEVKHKATVSGLVEVRGLEDLMKVYVAWTGFLSRRAFSPGSTEDDVDMAEVGILSSLENVQKVVAETAGDEKARAGDPQYRLERMYIKLLFKKNDQVGMRKMWNDLANKPNIADTYDFWNRYYIWALVVHERNRHTDNVDGVEPGGHVNPNPNQPFREGTSVLERALARVETLDLPEQLIQQYINHCEQHETILEYRKAILAARRAYKTVAERREREATAWKMQQEQANHAHAQANPTQEEPGESTKRKRDNEESVAGHDVKKVKQNAVAEIPDVAMTDAAEDSEPKRDREHTVILVKNLPEDATELQVKQFFRDCGIIKGLNLVTESGSDTKIATIEFESKEDALYAQTKVAKPFGGNTIEIEFSTGAVLWVANYPPAADEKYIRSLFQSHGEILQVRFPSVKLNTNRRFCYVQFASPMDAKAASDAMDGKVLDGKFHLQAKISDPSKKQERSGALHEGREVIFKNVDWSATEDDVTLLVEGAVGKGTIEKVHIPRTLDGRSKGTAFVSLATKDAAEEVVKKFDNTPFKTRTLKVEVAIERGKRTVGRIVRPGSEAPSTPAETNGHQPEEQDKKSSTRSRTIALLNVPDTVNAARLEALVSPHGEITKLTLRTDHAGAIVEFADEHGAGKAGMALEGQELDGNKLRVGTVTELLKEKPIVKNEQPRKKGFGAGVVSRPRIGNTGPKARLGAKPTAAHSATNSKNGERMDVDGEKKAKTNDDFRKMLLGGK